MSYEPHWPWNRPVLNFDAKKCPWWLFLPCGENRITLEYHALKYVPEEHDLERFEQLGWRRRQLILARLRRLESEVNLKPLSIPVALLSAGVVITGIQIRALQDDPAAFWTMVTGVLSFLAIFGILLIPLMRVHMRKEACLTAWTEAFKDSHTLRTKIEEENRKSE